MGLSHNPDKNNWRHWHFMLVSMAVVCHSTVSVFPHFHRHLFLGHLLNKYVVFFSPELERGLCSSLVYNKSCWGIKGSSRSVKLRLNTTMTDPKIEDVLTPLRFAVKEQGDLVRSLKASSAPEIDIKKAIAELKLRKKILEDKELALIPNAYFDRNKMEDLLKRRFFYDISFSIYGGVAGQFDFGPMGCALKSNIISLWRSFFVLEEQMLEVDCSIITPEVVLKTSGHVDRFADLMVKDIKTGECFRLDHLIKSALEKLCNDSKTTPEVKNECNDIIVKLDGMTKNEMQAILKKFNIKSPLAKNELSEPIEFNLMFGTQVGPSGLVKGFLRPETAQGIFVNFERLLEFNQDRLPFAAAQVGQAFRNEISPRSGLVRVREFTLAEIEHFCHPEDKNHPKFSNVADTVMCLYSACNQMDGKGAEQRTIGDAVKSGLVANETLGYYMAKIHLFLLKIGIDPTKLRFRQHMSNEMAHYASDCWDAECLTSYGWMECVGCADRSAYDLTQHSRATGKRLKASKPLPEPKIKDITELVPNNKLIGQTYKKSAKGIRDALTGFNEEEIMDFEKKLAETGVFTIEVGNEKFEITKEMVDVKRYQKTVHVEEFTPSVIEPSFGIGRIMYALFEQTFRMRDEQRTYLSLPASVAPLKCSILPLRTKEEFQPFVKKLASDLTKLDISHKIDDNAGSIGKRYARTDEIAIPYGITIDMDSFQTPHTVTLRERDSMSQVRLPLDDVAGVISDLARSRITWEEIQGKYPKFEQQECKEE